MNIVWRLCDGVSFALVFLKCLILRDTSKAEEADSVYEIVEDEIELSAVSKVFEELLEDVDIEL